MRHLDDPASGFLGGVALELTGLLSTAFDVRDVAMGFNDVERRLAGVARVGTQGSADLIDLRVFERVRQICIFANG